MNTNRRTLALLGGAIASVAFVGGAVAFTGGDDDTIEVVSVAAAAGEATTTTTEAPSIEFPNPATGGAAGALAVAGDEPLEVDEPAVDPEPVPTTAPMTTVAPAPPTTEAPPVPTEPAADSILAVRCNQEVVEGGLASDETIASIDPTYDRTDLSWSRVHPICKQLPGYPWGLN